ncbi:MAG: glycosyltransferase [Methanobrevibacter sp.]|uniref:glycosyltransferase n=1 Tax=Methanobrevibacter sp. TaxID=66852 RepID=UPI0025E5284B|nr:glycosyltransferase [Methanobrevibacter sp.]MBE6497289.1 glycosyltransferase [Methanobrevibacter sp.]
MTQNINNQYKFKKDKITISTEDLDKQLEFYNKTLNEYEILNHNYTLKLNSLQTQNNNLKNQNANLKKDYEHLKKINNDLQSHNDYLKKYMPEYDFKKGISVLVPTYKAEEFVLKFLDSMKKQTLDYELFEVLFVINGERDNTENLIREFSKNNPEINIEIIESEPGATTARNKGIDELNREYVVFIDVDDFISPNYLYEAYKHCAPNRIIIGDYYDIDENTGEISETYFTKSFKGKKGIIDPYSISQGALLIATNKVMPTRDIKTVKFDPNLKSGDDHDYFCRLYSKFDYEFYFVGNDCDAIYYRLVVSNSVSRQPLSYDFNIIQRLEVMKKVDDMHETLENPKMEKLLDLTMNSSQMTFIIRYLERYPEHYTKVLNEIKRYDMKHFDYNNFKNRVLSTFNKIIIKNSNENKKLKEENSNLAKVANGESENELENLKKHENELIEEINNLKKENANLKSSNKKLLELDNKKVNENIIDLKKQNEKLLASNKELLDLNNKLINSNSWKLTEPLRKIKK